MRVWIFIFACVAVAAACHAQNSVGFRSYENSSQMINRWDSGLQKALDANNAYYAGKADKKGKRKKAKPDPTLKTEFEGRTFLAEQGNFDKKMAGQNTFLFDQKVSSDKFVTRSFLGIRNPWFGKKEYSSSKANLLTKSDLAIGDKKFQTDAAETKAFYQAGKTAHERLEPVPTKSTKVEPKAQGMLSAISSQKNLTVDEVRKLLNKGN